MSRPRHENAAIAPPTPGAMAALASPAARVNGGADTRSVRRGRLRRKLRIAAQLAQPFLRTSHHHANIGRDRHPRVTELHELRDQVRIRPDDAHRLACLAARLRSFLE